MPTAVISGISGYTGSHLAQSLVKQGWNVIGLVRETSRLPAHLNNIPTHIYKGDVASLVPAFAQADVVFHLAAHLNAKPGEEHQKMLDANITFGVHMLDAMLQGPCRNFINTGTFWQQAENAGYQPMNFYAATKQAFSDILSWYAAGHGVKAVTLQMYDIYGPNDSRPKIFTQLKNAGSGELPMSGGEQKLFPVFIDDVVQAYVAAHKNIASGHAVYSVAGEAFTLRSMVGAWVKAALDRGLQTPKLAWGKLPYRDGQIMNPFKGKVLPGWQPKVSLHEGISRLF